MSAIATSRLFLALWPDAAVVEALRAWQRGWDWPAGAAVEAPERLHLTLHFIGNVPGARLPELTLGLRLPLPAFGLEFGSAEHWPHGLVVLRPLAVPQALTELHQGLAGQLQRLSLPVEKRPFRPHLTLARKAAKAGAPPEPLQLRWQVRDYVLVLSKGGYHTLARYA